jgi:hypothetical protein
MRQHRIIRSAALALGLAVFAAPAAVAQQDLRNPDSRAPAASVSLVLRNPDSRAPAPVQAASVPQDLRAPDTVDAANGRGTFSAPEVTVVKVPQPAAVPSSSGGGLDWTDAGIGAGGMLAMVLLAAGGTIVALHRRQRTPAGGRAATTA